MVDEGVEARFYASIFTIRGHTEVQVVNNSTAPIEFHPAPTVIVGANGSRLPVECRLPDEPRLSIEKGQIVTVRCGFEAHLRGFSSYQPEFDTLTLLQPGFSRNGKPIEIVVSMRGS